MSLSMHALAVPMFVRILDALKATLDVMGAARPQPAVAPVLAPPVAVPVPRPAAPPVGTPTLPTPAPVRP